MSLAAKEACGVLDQAAIFRLRGLLPLPVVLIMVAWAEPTPTSFLYGGVVAVLGAVVRLWAAGYIKEYRSFEAQADLLVTAGPYAHVRNPLYWGNFLIGIGFCVIANWWLAYPLFLALYAYMYSAVVAYEECHLAARFGAAYQRYCAEVPRFWPRLVPYKGVKGSFSLRDAVRGEFVTWCVHALAAALFAVKLVV